MEVNVLLVKQASLSVAIIIYNSITIFGNWGLFHDVETTQGHAFQTENKEKHKKKFFVIFKVICMGDTNQFGISTCHHNKKLN